MNRHQIQHLPLPNPFATNYLSPGRLTWIECDVQLEPLAVRFRELQGRAAIVGPHGVGKSSLLTHLVPLLQNDPDRVFHCQLKGGERNSEKVERSLDERIKLMVVDGYEQLSWWERGKLLRQTARQDVQLLLTSHQTTLLPTLVQLKPNDRVLTEVIRQLIDRAIAHTAEPSHAQLYEAFWRDRGSPNDIGEALGKHAGSIREVLMDWYDSFETFSNDFHGD